MRAGAAVLLAAASDWSFELRLRKPLGIAFEEDVPGLPGPLRVGELVDGGSAAACGFVWPGDALLAIDDAPCDDLLFDDTMDALVAAPDEVTLTLRRDGLSGCAIFPDGSRAFGTPGTDLAELAQNAGFRVPYDCGSGHCGVCEMFSRDEGGDRVKPVRMCRSRLPKSAAYIATELLSPDSPEAREYVARMKERMNGG